MLHPKLQQIWHLLKNNRIFLCYTGCPTKKFMSLIKFLIMSDLYNFNNWKKFNPNPAGCATLYDALKGSLNYYVHVKSFCESNLLGPSYFKRARQFSVWHSQFRFSRGPGPLPLSLPEIPLSLPEKKLILLSKDKVLHKQRSIGFWGSRTIERLNFHDGYIRHWQFKGEFNLFLVKNVRTYDTFFSICLLKLMRLTEEKRRFACSFR